MDKGKVAGKIVGYQAFKDGRLDYEMDASDLGDFEKNSDFYAKVADGYNGGSDGMKMMGIGIASSDAGLALKGVARENKDFLTNPLAVALTVASLGVMYQICCFSKNRL